MKKSFTLLELLIVMVIVSIMVTLALPQLEGFIIRAKIRELYDTAAVIIKAEEIFYMETGFYAAANDEVPGYDLPYTINQGAIDAFRDVLGIDVPGINSVFIYSVDGYGGYSGVKEDATIYVRVREHTDWKQICRYHLEGHYKGIWFINVDHPWSKYFRPPGIYRLYSAGPEE